MVLTRVEDIALYEVSIHQTFNTLTQIIPYHRAAWQSPAQRRQDFHFLSLFIHFGDIYESHHAGVADAFVAVVGTGLHNYYDGILHLRRGQHFLQYWGLV